MVDEAVNTVLCRESTDAFGQWLVTTLAVKPESQRRNECLGVHFYMMDGDRLADNVTLAQGPS